MGGGPMDDTGHANKGDFFLGFIIYCHAIYMHASKQCVQCNECYKYELRVVTNVNMLIEAA